MTACIIFPGMSGSRRLMEMCVKTKKICQMPCTTKMRWNWNFLFMTLTIFGVYRIIHPLDNNSIQLTHVHNNNQWYHVSFTMYRGTRQGCPLSPSLFTIFIEAAVRQNPFVTGIQPFNTQHKISLYADDILMFLQNLSTSLQETIKLIDTFSKISNYSIYWTKSTILPISINNWNGAAQTLHVPIRTGKLDI